MYKDKKIIFRQVNEQHINIILQYEDFKKCHKPGFEKKEKIIGQIFSPAGTSQDKTNAIQVCGFSEAYDLWGCGIFSKPKSLNTGEGMHKKKYIYDSQGKPIMEQVKDIQLYYDDDTIKGGFDVIPSCDICFNNPCICENEKGFTVKREKDIEGLSHKISKQD